MGVQGWARFQHRKVHRDNLQRASLDMNLAIETCAPELAAKFSAWRMLQRSMDLANELALLDDVSAEIEADIQAATQGAAPAAVAPSSAAHQLRTLQRRITHLRQLRSKLVRRPQGRGWKHAVRSVDRKIARLGSTVRLLQRGKRRGVEQWGCGYVHVALAHVGRSVWCTRHNTLAR